MSDLPPSSAQHHHRRNAAPVATVVVTVSDTRTLETGYGRSPQSKLRPIAYNNPIYVDVDHNGWQPNGDTLGHPLLKAQ